MKSTTLKWLASLCTLMLFASSGLAQEVRKFAPGAQVTSEQLEALNARVNSVFSSNRPQAQSSRAISSQERMLIARIDPRIVGGNYVQIDASPWQVALILGFGPEPIRQQFCGGSIVSARWVVTAAHCVDGNTTPDRVDIVAGTTFYKYDGQRAKVEKIFVHKDWNPASMVNDIALLKLATPLSQGTPIPLSAAGFMLPADAELSVTGWGAIFEGGAGSEVLMGAKIPLVSQSVCNDAAAYNGRIQPSMLCAGLREGGLDSCQGDSGGPAAATVNGVSTLVGIVSWGEGCARKLKYGIYTSVSFHRPWIDALVAAN